MSWRKIGTDILAIPLFEATLKTVSKNPLWRRLANFISKPRGVYGSFAEASRTAVRWKHGGHEAALAIDSHARLLGTLHASDYAAIYWIQHIAGNNLSIFDYGGSVGNLYYNYLQYLPNSLGQLEWTVFDLPGVLEEGMRLAKERAASRLQFWNSVDSVTSNHIVLVSGSLHYWESSVADSVRQFPARPMAFLINRTPVHPSTSYFTVQKLHSYAVPCAVRSTSEILSAFADADYKLADQWRAPEFSLRMPLFPDLTVHAYSGFCFLRTDEYAPSLKRGDL